MFQELKLVFQTHARVKRYDTSDKYFAYKMDENSSTSEDVLRMSEYYNRLIYNIDMQSYWNCINHLQSGRLKEICKVGD